MLKEFEKKQLLAVDSAGPMVRGDSVTSLQTQLVFLDFDRDTSSETSDRILLKEALQSGGEDVRKALGLRKLMEDSLDVDSASIAAIRRAGEEGSPEALAVLGRCHERGIQAEKDLVTAALCYIRAIRLDSPRASELLWRLLQDEDITDSRSFFRILKARGAQGNADARYVWACLRALGFDGLLVRADAWVSDDQALQFLRQSSDQGHLPSMIELGLCLYAGRWVSEDQVAAMEMWTRAAHLGSNEARIRLAITTVRNGREVAEALTTLMNASRSGSVLADVALAYCYERGVGVEVTKGLAASLYRSAAQRGSQDAFRALKRMYDELRPPDKSFQVTN
jgi:TPR repeat protein